MQCERCGFSNLEGAAVCLKCEAALGVFADAHSRRPSATRQAERGRSKKRAGAPRVHAGQQTAMRPRGTAAPQQQTSAGERRHLTVMFCDLVDSTGLSARLDPEDLRHVIASYQKASAEIVEHFEGQVARYLGDGILVYFGYPHAHEDDADRAARAALGVIAAIDGMNARLEHEYGVRLAVRIGIDTGLVVASGEVGSEPHEPFAIFGETPNVAARLQSLAEPNRVVVSASTYGLIRGRLECESLGRHELKGIPQPVGLYRVTRENRGRSRLDASASAGLTALVDREQEIALLADRWSQVRRGSGQAVLIGGEAGIGKSRLVRVLKERVAIEPHLWLECSCSPYYQSTPLYAVIDLLTQELGWTRQDSPETKLAKLEQALARAGFAVPDVLPPLAGLLYGLLSLPLPALPPGPVSSPARRKRQTLEALHAWLARLSVEQPVVLVVEDLQWIDPSTLEFLSFLVDRIPAILLLLTARPEFHPPWPMHAHVTQLTLSRFGREQVVQMAEHVAGGKALPPEVVRQVVGRTDGIPLFVEELTKLFLDSDVLVREEGASYEAARPVSSIVIPASLHDSLMARLDRLGSAKSVAQFAAMLGREFSYELLQAVAPFDKRSLSEALARLVDAELLYPRGVPPEATYSFKHALIHDAAYQSLLKSARQQYHQRVAQVLIERFPEVAASQPELVAYHYTEGNLGAQAINYWYMAGQRAIESSANLEAISYLGKALQLLAAVPATGERTHIELALQTLLGVALMSCKGYGAPEVEAAFRRARDLCHDLGETAPFAVLRGFFAFAIVRGRLSEGRELAEQLLDSARRAGDDALLLEACSALGVTLFSLGEPRASRAWLEQGIALYDPALHRSHTQLYGADPGVTCRCYAAVTLWVLGYPDQALARILEARAIAEEIAQPVNVAFALTFGALVHQLRGEVEATRAWADAAVALATEQVLPFFAALASIFRGWAWCKDGSPDRGIAEIERGLAALPAAGAEVGRPQNCALLAEVLAAGGNIAGGLAALAEAFDAVAATGARYQEAELHHLRGEILLSQTAPGSRDTSHAEVEACFRRGIEVAHQQEARAIVLRCATSLARLLHCRGARDEARQVLTGVYESFTEGLETADLQAARTLLAQLQ